MDLLYTRRFDGFCLVSSDSDFTRLAARLREEGLTVFGFGEQKTPKPFVSACDKFIYTEILRADAAQLPVESPDSDPKRSVEAVAADPAGVAVAARKPRVPIAQIANVIESSDDEDGWVALAVVGSNITKLRTDFDPRLYGFKKLSELIKAHAQHFELQERETRSTGGKLLYVRNRKSGKFV